LVYAFFAALVGVGGRSDSFFSVLVVSQTITAVLFTPYENVVLRVVLEKLERTEEPTWSLLLSYLWVSLLALIPYYLVGEHVLRHLFGRAYAYDPDLFRYNLRVLGLLVPLSGFVVILQTRCQARGHYDVPKVALILGRLVTLLVLAIRWQSPDRAIGVGLVIGYLVPIAVCLLWIRPAVSRWAITSRHAREVLREWFHVSKWSAILRTDMLFDRILAAQLREGFLSLFTLAWSAMMSLVEAFQASFVAADSNRYYRSRSTGLAHETVSDMFRHYRRSSVAALWISGGVAVLLALAYVVGTLSGAMAQYLPQIEAGEVLVLFVTIAFGQVVFLFWKELAGMFTVQGHAVVFARLLVGVYLLFILPRMWLGVNYGSLGFCVGLAAYDAAQVAVLIYFLSSRRAVQNPMSQRE
jgi:hypothetical protein